MNMEDFVTYEQALTLKELGFIVIITRKLQHL